LPFHLTTQVGLFLQSGRSISSDDLFSVYVGGNDVRDAFAKFLEVYLSTGNPLLAQAEAQVIIGEAIESIKDTIELLATFGATNFLVPNVPNIGVTPAIQSLGPLAVGVATDLSTGFNAALEATLSGLESGYSINITRLNVFTLINNIVTDPGIADLANATEPCITPGVYKGAFCTRPDEYLFWDGIHPTRAGHAYLARAAKQALMP
jgi:phospholipase/lecithinase/hemolysin